MLNKFPILSIFILLFPSIAKSEIPFCFDENIDRLTASALVGDSTYPGWQSLVGSFLVGLGPGFIAENGGFEGGTIVHFLSPFADNQIGSFFSQTLDQPSEADKRDQFKRLFDDLFGIMQSGFEIRNDARNPVIAFAGSSNAYPLQVWYSGVKPIVYDEISTQFEEWKKELGIESSCTISDIRPLRFEISDGRFDFLIFPITSSQLIGLVTSSEANQGTIYSLSAIFFMQR